jgi:hypothetical protein
MNITDKFMIAATGLGSGLTSAGLALAVGWGASGPHDMAFPLIMTVIVAPALGLAATIGGGIMAYRRLRALHGPA